VPHYPDYDEDESAEKLSTECKFNSITRLTSLPVADEIEHVESFGKSTFLFHPIESFVRAFIDFLSIGGTKSWYDFAAD
jgi:hypothetical protein